MLPDTVVVYMDTTIGLPLLTSYVLARRGPRKLNRLYDRREEMLRFLTDEYHRVDSFQSNDYPRLPENSAAGFLCNGASLGASFPGCCASSLSRSP
jgi:hypothetical protein